MLTVKGNVDLRGLHPEALVGLMVALHVYAKHGLDFVLTSAGDGTHMQGSLHYGGFAFDCRLATRLGGGPGSDQRIADEVREACGPQFDVLLEETHIHVEFDPKRPPKDPLPSPASPGA